MKTLLFLSILTCFLKLSQSQDTCTTCTIGAKLRSQNNLILRDNATEVNDALTRMRALNFIAVDVVPPDEACAQGVCGDNSTCTNVTAELFECGCQESFIPGSVNTTHYICEDIQECNNPSLNNCSSLANCTNASPGFDCTCWTGYTGDGVTCEDMNECNGTNSCHENANCTNTNGSYECACWVGYTGDGYNCTDINECTEQTDNCHTNANCTNTNGSYECACWDGYSGDGFDCTEINECTIGTHNCSDNANCTNTNASYTCECHVGYSGDGFDCNDINECDTNTDNCSTNANCTNTNGSYTCECRDGFTGNGFTCTDINECTLGLHDCHSNATCNSTDGSYTCTCKEGFTGNGFNCTDVNECASSATNNCSQNANCTNTEGGFDCVCEAGYTGTGDVCDDINECNTTADNCHEFANCTNTNGSFTCACNPGYIGNGTYCEEINECNVIPGPCDTNANCTDLVNDYNCTCNTGYSGNGTYCENINECTTRTHNCHANATCTDTDGNYTCACDPGFSGDGYDCTPINECDSNPCDVNANCTDGNNNYTCTCNENYQGNGTFCERVRGTANITFYMTFDNRNYNDTLQDPASTLYTEITGLVGTEMVSFVQNIDANAGVDQNQIEYNFSTSADGLGYAEVRMTVYINNTNIEGNEYLRRVNTTSITALGSSASPDECTLEVDGCGAGDTCWDTPWEYCCFHDLSGLFNITIDAQYNVTLEDLTDAYTASLSANITDFMNITFLPRLQKRGCLSRLLKSIEIPGFGEGSIVSVLALLLNDATFSLQDISDELNKLAGENTTFGTILRAGDYDECIANFVSLRNCTEFAVCINFAGNFTCECNETRYDNGTEPGEICINPIIVGCGGNILNVSVLISYYEQKNISLASLHLADESCNRTTHATLNGDTIEFSVNINECNTTLAYSADNTSIIASNYISNLPSTGVFTGVEIVVPFECAMPVDLNITLGLNGTVDTVRLPNSQATGAFELVFDLYEDNSFTTVQSSSKTYGSTEIINAQVSIQNDIDGVSVKLDNCFGTPSSSRTDPEKFTFVEDGCSTGSAVAFNMLSNGQGACQFSFQTFFFTQVNSVHLHCQAQVCTPSCQQSCSTRRRKRNTAEFTDLVYLTVVIRLNQNDPMFNNTSVPFINGLPGGNSGTFTNDIALPIISAALAFVLIVLLALLVLVVVRKRRSSQEGYGVQHVNMHAIGVKPPEYQISPEISHNSS